MFSPLYEYVHALSGIFSVRNSSHNIRTEMISFLYLYESANCVPPGIASAQNISDKIHTDMVSLFYESVHALSEIFHVRNFSHNVRTDMFPPLYESVHALSGSVSVRNFSHNIRTEMMYESANCVPVNEFEGVVPDLSSKQNILNNVHTDMVSLLREPGGCA